MDWWPALVFGWPAVILALALAVAGIARRKPIFLVAAAVVLAPFSLYLGGTPGFGSFAIMIPVLILFAGLAVRSRKPALAWIALAPVVAILGWILVIAVGN